MAIKRWGRWRSFIPHEYIWRDSEPFLHLGSKVANTHGLNKFLAEVAPLHILSPTEELSAFHTWKSVRATGATWSSIPFSLPQSTIYIVRLNIPSGVKLRISRAVLGLPLDVSALYFVSRISGLLDNNCINASIFSLTLPLNYGRVSENTHFSFPIFSSFS